MFIIERRTTGVLAALATTAAVVVLGSVLDRVDGVETPATAKSVPASAKSVGPGVRPIARCSSVQMSRITHCDRLADPRLD
jgi:hypothetical protein